MFYFDYGSNMKAVFPLVYTIRQSDRYKFRKFSKLTTLVGLIVIIINSLFQFDIKINIVHISKYG